MQSVCGLEFARGNRFTYALTFTNAALDLFPRYEQISSHGCEPQHVMASLLAEPDTTGSIDRLQIL
ncbi:hypothetical protein Tco_0484948, partial [Tanacetum coccineum]